MTTNTDATIYNIGQAQDGSVRAFRHYLPTVHWYGRPAAQADGSGTARGGAYSVRIPNPVGYVPPRVWQGLSDAERLSHWTVQPDDLIVKGRADTTISDEDGHHLEELPQLYGEVCKVRFAHDNRGTNVPHLYVGGI